MQNGESGEGQVIQSPQPNIRGLGPVGHSPQFWGLLILTGIGAGVGGGLTLRLLQTVEHLCWSYNSGTFLDGIRQAAAGRHVLVLLGAGILAGAGSLLFRSGTGGHGGELSEAIWFHSGELPTWRTLGRAVLSTVVVAMGASLGREGAAKQTGAAIASRLSQSMKLPPAQMRLLAACGAGAGVAAIYNVPLGGALFALEVLLGELSMVLVLPAMAASVIATGVAWLIIPNKPTYYVPACSLTLEQTAWAVVVGPLLGLAAVAYVRLIAWADAREPGGWPLLLAPVVVLVILGFVSLPYPQLLGNGKNLVQVVYTGQLALPLLLILVILKPVATASCLASGIPGGLFTPTLTCGCLLGGLLGRAWDSFWPGGSMGGYALIGSGAVLAAATQGPISAIVLLLELTRRIDTLMVPLILAVTGAVWAARRFEWRSIYSARIHLGRAAAGEKLAVPPRLSKVVSPRFDVVSAAERYPALAHRLLAAGPRNTPLYVVDENAALVGEINRCDFSKPDTLGVPLEITTAVDLSRPVPALTSTMTPLEMEEQLRQSGRDRLPVIDSSSRRIIGIVTPSASGETVRNS